MTRSFWKYDENKLLQNGDETLHSVTINGIELSVRQQRVFPFDGNIKPFFSYSIMKWCGKSCACLCIKYSRAEIWKAYKQAIADCMPKF